MIKPYIPTNRGNVEEQLEEVKRYLMDMSRQLTQSEEVYQIIDQIYRAVTEERLDYNNAAVKELWNKLFQVSQRSIS